MSRKTSATVLNEPITLVIDAGHGGVDGGAVTEFGVRESDINLEIAKRTEALAALMGIATVMVRQEDISIHDNACETIAQKKASDLRNRVLLTQSIPNPILLSIHQNHFSESKYWGSQVFYNSDTVSRDLAEQVQRDFKTYLQPANHRKCKPAQNVYLMQHVQCPAILVECGFLSNSRDTELLLNASYQKKLTMIMLRAIVMQSKDVDNREV